jgi:Na+-transporting methylmalonyl-CoA/oxaloacetate decarboxylase beta subunit
LAIPDFFAVGMLIDFITVVSRLDTTDARILADFFTIVLRLDTTDARMLANIIITAEILACLFRDRGITTRYH